MISSVHFSLLQSSLWIITTSTTFANDIGSLIFISTTLFFYMFECTYIFFESICSLSLDFHLVVIRFEQSWVHLVLILRIQCRLQYSLKVGCLRHSQCQAILLRILPRIKKMFQLFCGVDSSQGQPPARITSPTHHGTVFKLNLHCILSILSIWLIASDLFSFFTRLHDAINVLTLYEFILSRTPLREINLFKVGINSSVVLS